ncbi:hypothetical protein TNIN_199861 [Trichonephila inaurata madagascariensis]|uniref:MRG-binding protein n=1 Tax=Trichonephila inaurata madagascariensis TaxID=2747483 RepID=A0A8X6XN47_9ARAC|nr:hypothetical protein TNIN_199861 [Trichonephila inaurata madagascariensis]
MNYNVLHEVQRLCEIVRKEMANKSMSVDEIEWNSRVETLLLYALFNLKPVGVNRFFTMVGIHMKFSNSINKEISSKVIWDHLDSMYDMSALHESEMIPFPNEEKEFQLPEEFSDIIKEKLGVSVENVSDESEALKNGSNKTVKKSNVSKLKQNSTSVNAKNTFAVPVPVKSSKNNSDSQPPGAEKPVKVKQETPVPTKASKVKRSSSPFTAGKNVKSEPQAKEEPVDVPVAKKTNKVESNNPSSAKKTPKSEPNSNASKKSTKQEPNANSVKQGKSETPDTSSKKIKNEKELSKKGRVSTSSENLASKKNSKSDSKKIEPDNNKKSNDTPSSKLKTEKNSNTSGKGTKQEEIETPAPSGSRKSVTKPDPIDKKRKRQKLEDSAKKAAPPAKRRRT